MLTNERLMTFLYETYFISSLYGRDVAYVAYIDTIVPFYGYVDFSKTHFCCSSGCLSMTVWAHAVLDVLYARAFGVFFVCFVLFFVFALFCTCSAQLSLFHMERCSENTNFIIIISGECCQRHRVRRDNTPSPLCTTERSQWPDK